MDPKKTNLIVFDMDGVLVDVSASYREAVRMTARLFFKGAPGWNNLPDPLFSLQELAAVKQTGGLNNDWELTYRILSLLMSRVHIAVEISTGNHWTIHEQLIQHADIGPLIDLMAAQDAPLEYLLKENNSTDSVFIQRMAANDVGSGNVIKQIFQELYLGQSLFSETYRLPSRFHMEEGLINRETLLVKPAFLRTLAMDNVLAIATGRPRAEADYPLKHFQIRPFFRTVFSLDDCLNEERQIQKREGRSVSLSKPHPFMLDAVAGIYPNSISKRYYIGDMPDDMTAASRSMFGFTGIGFCASAPGERALRQTLTEAGAAHVIENMTELPEILGK
jgi:phosphoglycolate phosphatase-like HAD superfamily hydrolase